jgi:hypothetical protein
MITVRKPPTPTKSTDESNSDYSIQTIQTWSMNQRMTILVTSLSDYGFLRALRVVC